MVAVDITCDLTDEDGGGYVWAFLRDARDATVIKPGALIVAGDEVAPVEAEVVEIVDKPAGRVVHLRPRPVTSTTGGRRVRLDRSARPPT